jgi:hypothetical protein
MVGTDGSACGIWNPRHMRRTIAARIIVILIIRTIPMMGELASSYRGEWDNTLSYLKIDITVSKCSHQK